MKQPIGIFDSGVGGLTVAAAIKEHLPGESFVYYGDTRHAPYGDKSSATIVEYSRRIIKFLKEENCKAVVIACNTSSAVAFHSLKKMFPGLVLLNVIDPVVENVVQQDHQNIGVIATRATIRSKVYARRLHKLKPELKVYSKATPLLAALIEEGFAQTGISKGVIEKYLEDEQFQKIDALILGCTHYPLIQSDIDEFFKKRVEILDSPRWVAMELRKTLAVNNMLNPASEAVYRFYFSEKTPAFNRVSSLFFGESLHLIEKPLSA